MKQVSTARRKPGRPRGFDRDAALHSAMLTFWAHGYETTSVSELSKAMGINAPALYSAFEDKAQLYREAVALYAGDPDIQDRLIQDAPSSRDAAQMVMGWAIARYTGSETPKGCLIGTSTVTGSKASADVRSVGAKLRNALHCSLERRIERDLKEGRIENASAETLAALVVCTVQGFSTLARDGASETALQDIATRVLMAWPRTA